MQGKNDKRLKIKSSVRDKRRYFIVGASNDKVEAAILEYIGILGLAKASYKAVNVPEIKGKNVGSCVVESLNDIRAALAFKGIRIEKVSGTISGLSR